MMQFATEVLQPQVSLSIEWRNVWNACKLLTQFLYATEFLQNVSTRQLSGIKNTHFQQMRCVDDARHCIDMACIVQFWV